MNITPERALELAEWAKDTASYFDTTDEHGYVVTEAEEEKAIYLQLSELARHYAEIAPKWQAVLDAEPVAWLKHGPYEQGEKMQAVCYEPFDDDCHSPLIIKPAP